MMGKIRLIDTHSHINFDLFDDKRMEVIENYRKAGGDKMILVGCDKDSSERAVKFSKQYEKFFATVGVHPTCIEQLTQGLMNTFFEQVKAGMAVAIGETGLDYYHMASSPDLQKGGLTAQARLAKELDVPVIIHSRDPGMVSSKIDMENKSDPGAVGHAGRDALEILKTLHVKKALFHCFSYDPSFAEEVWHEGFYTSFSGIITYPKNDYLREVARYAPADKILIETDCPYLTPQSKRDYDNEPAFVLETAKELARVRGVSVEEVSELTAVNAEELFGI